MTTIIGIMTENKLNTSIKIQNILTEFGCCIKTRLGINNYKDDDCKYDGLILIDVPDKDKAMELKEKLGTIKNVTVKSMEF